MATQQDYEAIVSIPQHYHDFKMTARDLPSTQGRLEHYLSDHNVKIPKLRLFLILLLVSITFSTVGIFLVSNPTIKNLRATAQNSSYATEIKNF